MSGNLNVLVIDDSAYNRRTIAKMLESIPGVVVKGYACDGEEGLRKVFDLQPDLITLDIEMPKLDGFSFLRILMQNRPTPVIVVSARADDDNVFKALEFGAVDFVAKPTSRISPELFNIKEDLLSKVVGLARTDMKKVLLRPKSDSRTTKREADQMVAKRTSGGISQVVIGASTGGPPALQTILSAIQSRLDVGIAIAQHMPPVFTRAFADRLNKFCALNIREAQTGDIMEPGRVLIAPGGKNLTFQKRGTSVTAVVSDPLDSQRYTPSVDALFSSASEVFESNLVGVVLTGMGNDGAKGIRDVKNRGGRTLAEAEETSVVFGMPKEAIATGCVDKILPLSLMSREILRSCGF